MSLSVIAKLFGGGGDEKQQQAQQQQSENNSFARKRLIQESYNTSIAAGKEQAMYQPKGTTQLQPNRIVPNLVEKVRKKKTNAIAMISKTKVALPSSTFVVEEKTEKPTETQMALNVASNSYTGNNIDL